MDVECSDEHDYARFCCHSDDPRPQWVFCLCVAAVLFAGCFICYLFRIGGALRRAHFPFPGFAALSSRFIFAAALLLKATSLSLMAHGFNKQLDYSVFKYPITDLADYILASSLTYLMFSWCQSFVRRTMRKADRFLWGFRVALYLYNGLFLFGFSLLFCLRCVFSPDDGLPNWHFAKSLMSILRSGALICFFIGVLFAMKLQMEMSCSCGLGNPEHYLFTLCSLIMGLELLEMIIRVVIARNSTLDQNECNETNLLLSVLLVAIGQLAPLGFVAMTDVIALPTVEPSPGADNGTIFDG
jgi:hypothetical protein